MLGSNWKNLVKKLAKNDLKKLFITHPQTLKDLLALYKNKRPQPYDFTIDPLGEIIWESFGHEAAEKTPLKLADPSNQEELQQSGRVS
jgi:hypothetical protein